MDHHRRAFKEGRGHKYYYLLPTSNGISTKHSRLEVDNCDGAWRPIAGGRGEWDGFGADTLSIAVKDTLHEGALRFRFRFISDGAISDQDGLWNTDGAAILDPHSLAPHARVKHGAAAES